MRAMFAREITGAGLAITVLLLLAGAGAHASSRKPATASSPNQETHRALAQTVPHMIAWIVARTGWDIESAPPVRFVASARLAKMYYGDEGGSNRPDIHALYSIERHTIYLADTWRADVLRDRSALLHELVHHLQILNKAEVDCPAQYDLQASHLQMEWLRGQGIQDPAKFFNLNEFVIYLMSQCPDYY